MATDTEQSDLLLPLYDLVGTQGRWHLARKVGSDEHVVILPGPITDGGRYGVDVAVVSEQPMVDEGIFDLTGGYIVNCDVSPDSFSSTCSFLDEEAATLAAEGF